MPRPRWGRKAEENPEGQIRASQIVTTFGPGAMLDLVDQAVLVGGLDFWSYDTRKGGLKVISEPRLRDAIVKRGVPLAFEHSFREPPVGDDDEPTKMSGVQVLEFPRWFVCQRCRALTGKDGLAINKDGRRIHDCDGGTPAECVPVRFVLACKRGHVEDFHWIWFAHPNTKPCPAPKLELWEGATGDFTEIEVRCTACKSGQRLQSALIGELNPTCGGDRLWLGQEGRQDCAEKLRLLVRTASNSYFAQVVSALSVPEKGRELEEAVQRVWNVVQVATPATLGVLRSIPDVAAALKGWDDASVLAVVEQIREGRPPAYEPIRTAEYRQFLDQPAEMAGEIPEHDDLFFARSFVPEGGLPRGVSRLVLAHKLREVRVQVGFTRLEPVTPDLQGEFELGVKSAAIGLETKWLPATEVRGEGVFLQLDEAMLAAWEERPAVVARARALEAGYARWCKDLEKAPPFPGARFYLLHSLSHLLISAISLECGYAASAIRERIYCAPAAEGIPMAAILLSTGTSGTEGTLGGLVEQGRRVGVHLRQAYEMGSLCSNDPVCAGHSPDDDPEDRPLEGAACHGCLFVAECSCERFNRYLDRALVVPTIGRDPTLAFFAERP